MHPNGSAPYAHRPVLPTRQAPARGVRRVQCLSSLQHLGLYVAELEALRVRSNKFDEILSMPAWLAARYSPSGWVPRTLLLRNGTRPEAAVFLLERTLGGLPTGYFRGGDALGETLILCESGREEELLKLTIELYLKSHRAFAVLLDQPCDPKDTSSARSAPFTERTVTTTLHWQHQLQPTFEATVAPFGHRTRRNLRNALRRVERNGWQFLPNLNARQLIASISHLSRHSTHPFPLEIAVRRLRLAAETPESFAMGLLDADGRWLSCLIGRRCPATTDIFWQSNAVGHSGESLCTTMRSLFMRHEVGRASAPDDGPLKVVRYIGGTCSLMQHCCTPTASYQTSLTRRGLRLTLARALVKLNLLSSGHPLRSHL